MITLRQDQETDVASVRGAFQAGFRSVLLVRGTGTGKTVIFSFIGSGITRRRKRVIALAHRDELLNQISETFGKFDLSHGIISSGAAYDRRLLAHVASVQTIIRRLDRIEVPDYAIVDEAHHCCEKTSWGKILAYWREKNPNFRTLGVTATPKRLSGEGLGEVFDEMVVGLQTAEAIKIGVLSPYRLIAPPGNSHAFDGIKRLDTNVKEVGNVFREKPHIIGDAAAHYRKFLDGAPSIAFCPSIEVAEQTAEKFRAAGWNSVSIDGNMDLNTRRNVIRDFAAGLIHLMPSVSLIDEGFDCPGIIGMLDLSPSDSEGRVLQRWGRTLRIFPRKTHAILIDHVGNTGKIVNGEFVPKHGLPDDPREWSLIGTKGKKTKAAEASCRQCATCYAVSPAAAAKCRECGAPFPLKPRIVEEVAGELSEIEVEQMRLAAVREQASADTLEGLTELGKRRGMKNPHGWARHVIEARNKKRARQAAERADRYGSP